mgnify:CR=1 FL=1
MENQLHEEIALIKKIALGLGKKIEFDFTGDGGSLIVVNRSDSRVSLICVPEGGASQFFNLDIRRYEWAHSEGFTVDDMTENPLKNEIFKKTNIDDLVKNLMGE